MIGGADQVGVQNWLAHRANDIVLRVGNVVHLHHALDRRRARRRHPVAAAADQHPGVPQPLPRDRLPRRARHRLLHHRAGRRLADVGAHGRAASCSSCCSASTRTSMDLLIVTGLAVALLRRDRAAAGGLDGPQRSCPGRDHADPRRDADAAVLHLPAAADAVLRHRRRRCRGLHADLLAAAGHADRGPRAAAPAPTTALEATALDGPDEVAAAGEGRAADGQARPSSWASTRPRWPRCRWPPSPPSSTAPASASRSCARSTRSASATPSCPASASC